MKIASRATVWAPLLYVASDADLFHINQQEWQTEQTYVIITCMQITYPIDWRHLSRCAILVISIVLTELIKRCQIKRDANQIIFNVTRNVDISVFVEDLSVALDLGYTTLSLLSATLRLFFWFTTASKFNLFYFFALLLFCFLTLSLACFHMPVWPSFH